MDLEIKSHIEAVERAVSYLERDGQSLSAVTLGRCYDTTPEDLWDAATNGERIPCWFLPVTGDLQLNGRFQLEGNAGGTITACTPPSEYTLTWEFGGDVSWVDVKVSPDQAGGARLSVTHTARLSPHWEEYGPGAVGVGWEGGLLGLALYIAHPNVPKLDVSAFVASAAGQAFYIGSSKAWGEVAAATGTDPEQARAAAKRTTAFYTGKPVESL